MSVKVMAMVWDCGLPQDEKLVLLSYADHADHLGNNVYPSVGLTAWKTGYSERSVQYITKKLIHRKVLVPAGTSRFGTNAYSINLTLLPARAPYIGGAKIAPPLVGGVQVDAGGGASRRMEGCKAFAPDPSLTIINPPKEEVPILTTAGEICFLNTLGRSCFDNDEQRLAVIQLAGDYGPANLEEAIMYAGKLGMNVDRAIVLLQRILPNWGKCPTHACGKPSTEET